MNFLSEIPKKSLSALHQIYFHVLLLRKRLSRYLFKPRYPYFDETLQHYAAMIAKLKSLVNLLHIGVWKSLRPLRMQTKVSSLSRKVVIDKVFCILIWRFQVEAKFHLGKPLFRRRWTTHTHCSQEMTLFRLVPGVSSQVFPLSKF